jgi:hypothetical protein
LCMWIARCSSTISWKDFFFIVLLFPFFQKGDQLCGSISGLSLLFHWYICSFTNTTVLITIIYSNLKSGSDFFSCVGYSGSLLHM